MKFLKICTQTQIFKYGSSRNTMPLFQPFIFYCNLFLSFLFFFLKFLLKAKKEKKERKPKQTKKTQNHGLKFTPCYLFNKYILNNQYLSKIVSGPEDIDSIKHLDHQLSSSFSSDIQFFFFSSKSSLPPK